MSTPPQPPYPGHSGGPPPGDPGGAYPVAGPPGWPRRGRSGQEWGTDLLRVLCAAITYALLVYVGVRLLAGHFDAQERPDCGMFCGASAVWGGFLGALGAMTVSSILPLLWGLRWWWALLVWVVTPVFSPFFLVFGAHAFWALLLAGILMGSLSFPRRRSFTR